MASHCFTTSAPTWPIHAIDPRGFTPWEHEPDEFDREADEDCEWSNMRRWRQPGAMQDFLNDYDCDNGGFE